ncbi:MAG: hypothetical protein KA821_08400 [Chitinophagaceae bacterium]|nr:hypothetical protein [Chitinophagaceae bacterium]
MREIIYLDTTYPVGLDTVDKTTLTYDDQNRLTKMLLLDPFDGFTVLTEFFYRAVRKNPICKLKPPARMMIWK